MVNRFQSVLNNYHLDKHKITIVKRKLFIICILCFTMNLYAFSASGKDIDFTVNKGVIYCKSGIPETPRWFADSRLAFSFEETGVTQVDYYYPECTTLSSTIFLRNLWDGFRYYLVRDDLNFPPEYQNNKIWPFGLESEWTLDNQLFSHRVLAVDEAIIFQLTTPAGLPQGYRFKFDFNVAFALTNADVRDIRFLTEPGRKWKNWQFSEDENLLIGGFIDTKSNQSPEDDDFIVCCTIGGDFPMTYKVDKNVNVHALLSPVLEPGKTYSFIITFGDSKSDAKKKNEELIQKYQERITDQFERYEQVRNSMPVLVSSNNELNNYFSLLPMYHESLKITDYPGAIRAKTTNYWVWIWDGITCNSATAYWGDVTHIKNMLKFYKETADPEGGILLRHNTDMKSGPAATIPAQGMYVTLLQLYYDQTGDIEGLKENYEFAKKIFNMASAKIVKETGLSSGLSLTPDFMSLVGETGNDISALNNSVFYCAARSLNRMAALLADDETLKKTQNIIQKMGNNFLKYFYNEEKKYIVSSIDASTFDQRQDYQSYSLRWENAYYKDLVNPIFKDCMDFYAGNLVCKPGIRAIPLWCASYDADANQLHSWWPVTDESFVRMVNEFNRKDLMDQWIGWLTYWYEYLTCPEGISCLLETDEPEPDRWSALKGSWYGMTMREWYQGVIHSYVGVDADAGGVTFYPYSGDEVKLLGMHFLGKTFDIEMKGSGPFIEYIEVNGKKIRGTNKLPLEYYQNDEHIIVTVKRTADNPYPVFVKSGAGIVLQNYHYDKGTIKTQVEGAGLNYLVISSEKLPIIKINNKKVKVDFNADMKLASLELKLKNGEPVSISIE
jgi:hypothetical protein